MPIVIESFSGTIAIKKTDAEAGGRLTMYK